MQKKEKGHLNKNEESVNGHDKLGTEKRRRFSSLKITKW